MLQLIVVRIGLAAPRRHRLVEIGERVRLHAGRWPQAHAHLSRRAAEDLHVVERTSLRAAHGGVHGVEFAVHHILVERILERTGDAGVSPEARRIARILGEQELWLGVSVEPEAAERLVFDRDHAALGFHGWFVRVRCPRPRVAQRELRDQPDRRRVGTAVVHRDEHERVVRPGLRVLHEHVEVAVVVKGVAVDQVELGLVLAARLVLRDEFRIGEFSLRILVQHLLVRVARRGVEVPVHLLHILAVIAFAVRETEQTLLEDRDPRRSTWRA